VLDGGCLGTCGELEEDPMGRLTILVALCGVLAGCGDGGIGNSGDVVGGPCVSDADCARGSQCARGGDFPDGTCVVRCANDGDCPGGTACIDEEDGICLLLCDFDDDCRIGYECDDKSRQGHSGSATVCIAD
jgi:hypothetical protein